MRVLSSGWDGVWREAKRVNVSRERRALRPREPTAEARAPRVGETGKAECRARSGVSSNLEGNPRE